MSRIEELMNLPDSVNPEYLEKLAEETCECSFHTEAIEMLALKKIATEQANLECGKPLLHEKTESRRKNTAGKAKRRISRIMTALALCALICSIGTAAFATFSTDTKLLELLHADSRSQMERLQDMHTVLNQSEQVNGYKVTLKEVIGDRHNFWLLMELEAPENIVLDENTVLFGDTRIQMEKMSGHGYAVFSLPDDNPMDNLLSLAIDFSARRKIAGEQMTIQFGELKKNILDENLRITDEAILAEGPWKFVFTLPRKDNTITMWQWRPIKLGDDRFILQKIEVSPLSLTMDTLKTNISTYSNVGEERPEIILQDGTRLIMESNGSGGGGGIAQYQYTFPYPMDLSQIDGIVFCGENLRW